MPASASAATTLTLAGKPAAASRAVPENTSFASFSPSTEMPFFTRCGAPARPFGGFRVVMRTELTVPSATAATASSPRRPPLGTTMRPPCCLASSMSSGRGNSAPHESTITCLPTLSIGRQISSSTAAGAHSTARSACCGNSSSGTIGASMPSSSSQPRAFSSSRDATHARSRPGIPSASLRASTRPIVPSPAIAMRMKDPPEVHSGHTLRQSVQQRPLDPSSRTDQAGPSLPEVRMVKVLAAALTALSVSLGAAAAQDYPTRPITMIIPFAAGGPTDVLGRVVAARMSETLGQQIVIKNATGAGGMTGANRVKIAPPDGYTILLGTVGTQAQRQTLSKKALYEAGKDFQPVALLADVPLVLIVHKDLPVNNIKEFADYTKKNQDKMSFASSGVGAAVHLGTVLLNSALGVNVTHVPYRGSAPAMQDLQGGRVDYMTEIVSTAYPQIKGDAVKPIAALAPERIKNLPDVPTAKEGGLDVTAYTWNAIFLPNGTPEPIVKKLNAAAVEAMKSPGVREKLEPLGVNVMSEDRMTPAYLDKFVKDEIVKWGKAIKDSGATVD